MKLPVAILTFFLATAALAQTPAPIRVEFADKSGWHFQIAPDGSVFGQYGSTAGDAIELPPGTVSFAESVAFVERSLVESAESDVIAAVRHEGEGAITLKPLKDDAYLQALFLKHQHDWKGTFGNALSDRLRDFMRKIYYYRNTGQ